MNRQLKTAVRRNEIKLKPNQLMNLFAELESVLVLLKSIQPHLTSLTELLVEKSRIDRQESNTSNEVILSRLEELVTVTKDTQENSAFVKMVFTHEKAKKTKIQTNKSAAINEYLRKYNKSMKL